MAAAVTLTLAEATAVNTHAARGCFSAVVSAAGSGLSRLGVTCSAQVSEDPGGTMGTQIAAAGYRWLLGRWWGPGRLMVWIGLNPSTATAGAEDATARRFRRFAQREDCGGYLAVNLCAYRATSPQALRVLTPAEAAGPGNDEVIHEVVCRTTGPVVCAWGAGGAVDPVAARARIVAANLAAWSIPCHTLGVTAAGHPAHPLRLAASTPLLPWQPLARLNGDARVRDPQG